MGNLFRFNVFEITIFCVSLVTSLISGILLLSGTSLNTLPNFSEAIPPAVFETEYVVPNVDITATPTPIANILPPIPVASNSVVPVEPQNLNTTPVPSIAPAVSPYASIAPSKYEKIYLLYPTSQAILTNTRADEGKGYQLKLKFEVDPQNTPCRLELKMGEEVILVKELAGSPTGLYEISVTLKKPALYKWQVFTQSSQSGERLFTVRK